MMSGEGTAKNLREDEYFYGHKACAGCGGSLAVRMALKVLGERTFLALPAGCMSAVGFVYPQLCFSNNAMITPFAATGAVLTGMEAGARALGLKDYHILGMAGDGGTADIGLQALSGAIDRGDRVIYICYDNEAYMNTGIQKSGLTPYGARTTTTPAGSRIGGNRKEKKNVFEIVAAHGISYAATASIAYMEDFLRKVQRASQAEGTSYIHVLAPCPTGWGIPVDETINAAKQVVDCGLWYLAEYYDGGFHLNKDIREFTSAKDYLKGQSRFAHLQEEDIAHIQAERDAKWDYIRKNWELPG
jgi:pyruvate ferredoxin oxidoreductase beta subunit